MRSLAGIVLIAFLFTVIAFAQEPNSDVPYSRTRNLTVQPSQPPTFQINTRWLSTQDLRSYIRSDEVCYTMHTLVVAREKGSDATRLIRQLTCAPASQFRMNHSSAPRR